MKTILKILGLCAAILTCGMVVRAQDTTNTNAQRGDLDFASKATVANNFELQAANIALAKSQDQNIKQYAQMIVDDHTTAGNELSSLVKNKNWQLSTPDNQDDTKMIDQLNNADAAKFDQLYTDMMAKSHQDAITLFKDASSGTAIADADLRKFASDKIPTFEKHLDQIKNMKPANSTTVPNASTTVPKEMPKNTPGLPSPSKGKLPKPIVK